MSQKIGRSAIQCKSKMQKFEKEAFIEILNVPKEHYSFFELLRKIKTIKKKNFKILQMFKKKNNFNFKKYSITNQIWCEELRFKCM